AGAVPHHPGMVRRGGRRGPRLDRAPTPGRANRRPRRPAPILPHEGGGEEGAAALASIVPQPPAGQSAGRDGPLPASPMMGEVKRAPRDLPRSGPDHTQGKAQGGTSAAQPPPRSRRSASRRRASLSP